MPLNKLNLFKNSQITQEQFLKEYWHKKPLLIRNGINNADLSVLPNKTQLQQLSCREDIQSRIVFKQSETEYDVEYGPFIENDFEGIDQDCWNLLVSDIDKWLPKSRNILAYFNFIRNWIFDDIMVSCGSTNGTVGPHTDHYDVFLIQVHGQREWSYTTDKIYNPELMPEQALKLMSNFKADKAFILNPGDILYLPPEVAHYGIAKSEDCVTCSVGMRTPSHSELLTSYTDYIAQNLSDNDRFKEPVFEKQPEIGEVTESDLNNISKILIQGLAIENISLPNWYGKYITEYRSLFYEFNNDQDINELNNEKELILSPFSKSCYFNENNSTQLYVNGQEYLTSLSLAKMICNEKTLPSEGFAKSSEVDKKIIHELFENGSLIHK